MKSGQGTEAIMIRVEGIVQRVGFRRFVERMAWRFKLSGYVENLKDGSIRILVQGSKSLLDEFTSELKKAPEPILIAKLDSKRTRVVPSLGTFQIKSVGGPIVTEIQEAFGGMETQFGEYRQEFRSFAKRTDDNFKSLDGNFNDYRGEFREFAGRTDSNFKLLGDKYGEISVKLTQVLETLEKESNETRRDLARAMENFQRESTETKKELTRVVDRLTSLVEDYIKRSSNQ
jgi:acylphosphatase